MAQKNRIEIIYCPLCHWLPRSAWMAQELLYTFAEELTEVALKPSPEGGVFVIRLDGETIWDRETDGGFPDVKQLKQRVRDRVNPERNLGHLEP
jgi:selenoprotein W-related protein